MKIERILSLDVLRGITVMLMILVNNPGSWSTIYPPLKHAVWNGCTPTDLVFPFFIFIMGAAIPMAMVNKRVDGENFLKLLSRSLRIIALGLFLCFFSYIKLFDLTGILLLLVRLVITISVAYLLMGNFINEIKLIIALLILILLIYLAFGGFDAYSTVRIPGVLQRIGIVYFFASLLYLSTSINTRIIIGSVFLLLYWGAMTLIPVPFWGDPNLDPATNLAAWIDNQLLFGHLWRETEVWDPEGILSTIPAIVTGIIGTIVGQIICNPDFYKDEKMKHMTIIGGTIMVVGFVWSFIFPMNKSLWSSSFVLYTAGLATLLLCLFYYFIDVLDYKRWTKPFLYWGTNPMFVFFFSGILPSVLNNIWLTNPTNSADEDITLKYYLYDYLLLPQLEDPRMASFIWAASYVALWFVVVGILYHKKIFIKV